ncbi:MAG TPA: hypothetical protein VD838_07995 [Anaeromyxobacteraceae bacterium]|nr:hypothetical protein [Anaeromyxobacteraceae bacterium]
MAETVTYAGDAENAESGRPTVSKEQLAFLDEKHPVYVAWAEDSAPATREGNRLDGDTSPLGELALVGSIFAQAEFSAWQRNERRLRGGDEVLDELRPFDWERATGAAYRARQAQASYVNFPEQFASTLVGHLFREAPQPGKGLSFGTLGEVRRDRAGAEPTRAELVYYNATGTGQDGSQWDAFWADVTKRAAATGHRWIFVDAPEAQPRTFADELKGLRPYLVEFSPLDVINWHYENGQLAFAIVRVPIRNPRLVDGKLVGNASEDGFLLLVADSYRGFQPLIPRGGWYKFTAEKELIGFGDWTKTRGQIPLFPLFYERDKGTKERPAISRPGLTEMGQIAVSYMNLDSAADFDAWDAATSITWLVGVDPEAFNTAMAKVAGGNRYIPVPSSGQAKLGGASTDSVSIQDGSTGAVTADVFDRRLASKLDVVERVMMNEASSTPDSSGASKEAGFSEAKSPRLALMAANLEEAQNTAIYFLELRFGTVKSGQPSGSARWPREFDLVPVADDLVAFLEAQMTSGVSSPTATARALKLLAREKRVITDDAELEKVEDEYLDAVEANDLEKEQEEAERQAAQDALRKGEGGDPTGELEE